MKALRKRSLRPIGGVAGAIIAVSGGLGAAVGLYTVPDIDAFRVGGHAAYTNLEQRAVAASTLQPGPFGGTILRIQVTRGLRSTLGFSAEGSESEGVTPSHQGDQSVGVRLDAQIHTCFEDGCRPKREWHGSAPLGSFEFDPMMNTASFSAEVGGCRWVLTWLGEGEIVPFEGHGQATGSHVDGERGHAEFFAGGGAFGEASRTAQSHIELSPSEEDPSCVDYVRDGAPGYLTVGASAPENVVHGRVD